MTSLQERLFAMQDKQYAAFQAKLTLGVPMESFIGILLRITKIRLTLSISLKISRICYF